MIAMGTWAGQDLANGEHSVPTVVASCSDPIGSGIVKSAEEQTLSVPKADQFEAIPGHGVRAVVEGQEFYVGGPAMLKRLALTPAPPVREAADRAAARGQALANADDGAPLGEAGADPVVLGEAVGHAVNDASLMVSLADVGVLTGIRDYFDAAQRCQEVSVRAVFVRKEP